MAFYDKFIQFLFGETRESTPPPALKKPEVRMGILTFKWLICPECGERLEDGAYVAIADDLPLYHAACYWKLIKRGSPS